MRVTLLGLGGGVPESATVETWDALEDAEIVVGAGRLLDIVPENDAQRRYAAVGAEEIASLLARETAEKDMI